jgi:phosphoribosylformylglycinamidine synthase
MTPYEMMLSESQERMLMVLKPGREAEAETIFRKWELDFAVIGEVTDSGRMELVWNGETVCDIPLAPLADEAPLYDRPAASREEYRAWAQVKPLGDAPESADIGADLLKLMASPDLASRRWIWQQYDSQVGADTLQRPGGDAAVVRVHGTRKALAMSTDCTPRYCYADPYEGGKQAIAECYRNLSAVGARPLAVTNCLNFGNPQRPEIMAQFTGCLEGMGAACRALDFPIVSGNVSLYNESKATGGGSAILPTPAIGGVGLLDDYARMATIGFKNEGDLIWLIGSVGTHLGQSLWLREVHGREEGTPPPVDLDMERSNGTFVRGAIEIGIATAAHDISDGGLLTALTEMALKGGVGADIDVDWVTKELAPQMVEGLIDQTWRTLAPYFFGEDQGRFVITSANGSEDQVQAFAAQQGVRVRYIGRVGGDSLCVGDMPGASGNFADLPLGKLREANDAFFRDWMDGGAALDASDLRGNLGQSSADSIE